MSTESSGVSRAKLVFAAAVLTAGACASAHKSAAPDPALLASIPATLRMVGSESTWVAHGIGYELVTRSRIEVPPLLSQLDDQSRYFSREFGADPGKVVAAVRRVGPPGSVPEASAPVPYDVGPVVDLLVRRPLAKGEKADAEVREERFAASGPTAPIVRAWLSERASTLTGKRATDLAASARTDDPRVPAWAEEALPALAVPTGREDTTTARLAMQVDSLYPIYSFLAMPRPAVVASTGRGGEAGGRRRGGGGDGGGMGGGGMGGGRGGRGNVMGGMGGLGRGRPNSYGGNPRAGDVGPYAGPLTGNALFAAQALVFGRYLTVKEGPAFVGALVDAQIQSKDIAGVFAKAQVVPSNLERLDIEFHRWLIDRAARGK